MSINFEESVDCEVVGDVRGHGNIYDKNQVNNLTWFLDIFFKLY